MADIFENPLGTDGFEFVEFTSPEPERLKGLFELMGFTAVARHRSKNVLRFRQGDINFILNMEPSGQPAAFRGQHGAGANAMAFRVKDAAKAYSEALKRGAEPAFTNVGPMELNIPAIQAIARGDSASMPLDGPMACMLHEHDDAGAALARLRELTNGYAPPPEACNTYRALFAGLAELEEDLHVHIHLENSVLFPAAQALESGESPGGIA